MPPDGAIEEDTYGTASNKSNPPFSSAQRCATCLALLTRMGGGDAATWSNACRRILVALHEQLHLSLGRLEDGKKQTETQKQSQIHITHSPPPSSPPPTASAASKYADALQPPSLPLPSKLAGVGEAIEQMGRGTLAHLIAFEALLVALQALLTTPYTTAVSNRWARLPLPSVVFT